MKGKMWLIVLAGVLVWAGIWFFNMGFIGYDRQLGGDYQITGVYASAFEYDRVSFNATRWTWSNATCNVQYTENTGTMEGADGPVDTDGLGTRRITVTIPGVRIAPAAAEKLARGKILTEPIEELNDIHAMWVEQEGEGGPLILTFFCDEAGLKAAFAHNGGIMELIFHR